MPLKLARRLAVLVALVVPLQGMAAVAAGQCMALGHHEDGGEHNSSHAHAPDSHSHADSGKPVGESETNADCGPCIACCSSVSIAPLYGASILPPPAIAQYMFSQFPPIGIEPDGVYRPPLSL
ncbi:MAG TPA: hypothetical protein VHI32_07515 [Burkholderiales bacterium]|jgi:hypothetical protein|nr:hypothetical protein [Burkholderiales bacterium]